MTTNKSQGQGSEYVWKLNVSNLEDSYFETVPFLHFSVNIPFCKMTVIVDVFILWNNGVKFGLHVMVSLFPFEIL